jgi:glycosyltransferase involved in cell wall biosynthesis
MRPHVVLANTLLAAPEALTARRLGLPVVVHVHEAPPPGPKLRAAVRLAARAADVFVCVSEAAAATVRPHAGRTPVHVVRNGAPELERVVRGGRGPFTVGTVATVSRTKGTDVLYRAVGLALERRPSLRFVHAGQSDLHEDRRLDVELRGLLDDTALGAATTRLGFVPAAEVLPRLDAFVLASRSEAFPLATLEAMSAGVPVVAADVGGLREQIRHLEDGLLVPAGDERALADALVRLHDDTGLRRRLAAAARARVRRELTLERQAAGLHAAYLAALDLRFGPPVVRARAKAFRGGQSA